MAWSKAKRVEVERSFYTFLDQCWINSKDAGKICLGEHLYDGQRRFITAVFDGLEADKHKFFALKARQLGISTIARALTTFILGIHDGLKGACVFDTDNNKQESRAELEVMINDLPNSLKFPKIDGNNRSGLTLENDSKILFMSAGVRKSKSSGTLGRSVGLSLAHLSELCSYDNEEGLEAFDNSLSDTNPDRVYIYESTARGFNAWYEMWKAARKDDAHCVCIFLGWWSKPTQAIRVTDPDFERYGRQKPTANELQKIREVAEQYGHQITQEQLAWIRRKMDPGAEQEGDAPTEYEGNTTRLQEVPWTEDDAFQMTGAVFFAPEKLTEQVNKFVSRKYKTFMFNSGQEFTDMKIYPAANSRSIELKVWEDPEPNGVYCISADPAFGHDEKNDRSAIQVMRCYADGLDQCAEYAWPLIGTRQFAWAILALCGWYASEGGEVYLIVELNGPGGAVWDEIVYTRSHLLRGYQPKEVAERGLTDVFRNVRNYIYTRPDSMGAGHTQQWKTSPGPGPTSKIRLMERCRDFVSNQMLHIKSLETLEEMRTVTREGDKIEAQGTNKDDRVISIALAVRCWEERIRKTLSGQQRTREVERLKKVATIKDQVQLYNNNQLETFFAVKRAQRYADNRAMARARWRYR